MSRRWTAAMPSSSSRRLFTAGLFESNWRARAFERVEQRPAAHPFGDGKRQINVALRAVAQQAP